MPSSGDLAAASGLSYEIKAELTDVGSFVKSAAAALVDVKSLTAARR